MATTSRLSRVRERLTLPTVRRATGMLDGRHRSVFIGHGQDFDDLSEYRPGDDITDIDWKASARTGSPVIKRYQRESNLPLVLVVDTGRTMTAQSPTGESKAELALFVADVFAYLARLRGDTVALVAGDSSRLLQRPPRAGSEHAETLLRQLERALSPADGAVAPAGHVAGTPSPTRGPGPGRTLPPSDVARLLDRVLTWHRRRSLVVLVTDETRPGPDCEDPLRKLSAMHELVVIQVADDLAVRPGAGPARDVDAAAELPAFLREDVTLAAEIADRAEARRREVAHILDRRHVEHVTVTGADTLVDALADLLRRQRRVTAAGRRR